MNTVLEIILALEVVVLIGCVFALIGCAIISKKRQRILDAILEYRLDCYKQDKFAEAWKISYDDMISWKMRHNLMFWMWKYEAILPAEKFQLIKPFLKK